MKLLFSLLEQLGPGVLELLHAFVLQDQEHVGQIDPDRLELVEDFLGEPAAVPVTVSPVTSPWSATASIVFSGMVFTVFGATSSVT